MLWRKNMAQMKEQIKAPKIELSDEKIATLSDAEFKTLVIRMLTELVEFGWKLDEKMKAMLRETKENIQGTNSDAKETGTQINDLEQKEEINIQPEQNEETRIQKNEERLRNLWDNFNHSNIQITGVPDFWICFTCYYSLFYLSTFFHTFRCPTLEVSTKMF